ncbi:MAG: 50S ribosomal protein L22 [bacterium]|nr:50S ribosomal protein L22 [bacterium]
MAVDVATPAARASARYVRSSASKARAVLDLIRGESCERADEILQFSERRIARTVARCLDSAVANAEHNSNLPAEELYVAVCYADEGPTLKRWRPRARGRATPIMKRTCHITIVLARYSLEEREARAERGRAGSAAAEVRRRRVEASRAAELDEVAEGEAGDEDEVVAAEEAAEEQDAISEESSEEDAAPDSADGDKEI